VSDVFEMEDTPILNGLKGNPNRYFVHSEIPVKIRLDSSR
jgi:hypothetical protein